MTTRMPRRSTIAAVAAITGFFVLLAPHERPLTTVKAAPQSPAPKPAAPRPSPATAPASESPARAIDRRLDALTDAVLARLDEAERAEERREEQRLATAMAQVPVGEATRQARGAEHALAEYKEKTYPADLREIEEEIAYHEGELGRANDRLDWSRGMLKNKLLSEAQHGIDKAAQTRAELILKQAKVRRDALESTTKPRKLAELAGEIERTAEDLQLKTLVWNRERVREAAADLEAHASALNYAEARALNLVLDARSLRDRAGRVAEPAEKARIVDQAAAKLREAESIWADAQALRADSRRAVIEARLRRAASDASRTAPPPPPRPEPGRPLE